MHEGTYSTLEIERVDLMINPDDFLPEHLHHARTFYRQSVIYSLLVKENLKAGNYDYAMKYSRKQLDTIKELDRLKELKNFYQDYADREELYRYLSTQGVSYSFITKSRRSF